MNEKQLREIMTKVAEALLPHELILFKAFIDDARNAASKWRIWHQDAETRAHGLESRLRERMATLPIIHSINHTPHVSHANAAHIAAFNPTQALALLDRLEALEAELARWKTNHTAECTRIARKLVDDQCRESIDRVTDLEDRIATMLSLVEDHSLMIEQYDTFKARMDAAAQDGGT